MNRYLLDTNIASHIIRGDSPAILDRLVSVPLSDIFISAVTEAELLYGLEKRGRPSGLSKRVDAFLIRVTIDPWSRTAALAYAGLRAKLERCGRPLSSMDLMIAAHALSMDATLVTRDSAFSQVSNGLRVDAWN